LLELALVLEEMEYSITLPVICGFWILIVFDSRTKD